MKVLLPIALITLSGCSTFDPPEVAACEKYLVAKLKAPSTYKRINASSVGVPYAKPTEWDVDIEYDAANAFNTPIRDHQLCQFPLSNGRPDTSKYIDFDAALMSRAADMVDNSFEAAVNAAVPPKADASPAATNDEIDDPEIPNDY